MCNAIPLFVCPRLQVLSVSGVVLDQFLRIESSIVAANVIKLLSVNVSSVTTVHIKASRRGSRALDLHGVPYDRRVFWENMEFELLRWNKLEKVNIEVECVSSNRHWQHCDNVALDLRRVGMGQKRYGGPV